MNFRFNKILLISFLCIVPFLMAQCKEKESGTPPWEWEDPDNPDPGTSDGSKPRFIWIDASANFPDFANSRDNIRRDLTLAKNAGFTHIIVDVRPPSGDALFSTTKVVMTKLLPHALHVCFPSCKTLKTDAPRTLTKNTKITGPKHVFLLVRPHRTLCLLPILRFRPPGACAFLLRSWSLSLPLSGCCGGR